MNLESTIAVELPSNFNHSIIYTPTSLRLRKCVQFECVRLDLSIQSSSSRCQLTQGVERVITDQHYGTHESHRPNAMVN